MLSMYLHVVATKVVNHVNCNDKGLKVHRQESQKSKKWAFSEVTSTALPDSITDIKESFQLKIKFSKRPMYYQLLRDFGKVSFIVLIYFQSLGIKYLHDMNISSIAWYSNEVSPQCNLMMTYALLEVYLGYISYCQKETFFENQYDQMKYFGTVKAALGLVS